MKIKTCVRLFSVLFLLLLAQPVMSQSTNSSKNILSPQTLDIVSRCDRMVMKGFQRKSRGRDLKTSPEDMEEIEFKYENGSDGYIMIFVRDKNNPKRAAKDCMGIICKRNNLIAKTDYPDGACCYLFKNRSSGSFALLTCNKGKAFSEFYITIGNANDDDKYDLHSIVSVDFYEDGSDTPILEDILLPTGDYSINLFKFFLEVVVEKFQ